MKRFPHGGQYYPNIETKENWVHDLKLMEEANITFVRTAELMNTWDSLEPSEGNYQFNELEKFLDECAKVGIKALLGTGTNSAPYWLHKKDPEVNILSISGRRFPNNVVYGWACYNNPTFQQHAELYITNLVKRFKTHPALMGYQINNEIGYPFMPLGKDDIDVYCYCNHCKAKYRQWLKNKYKSLERLNEAWTWDSTMQIHQSWEDVEPPYAKPTSWGPITRWLDWRLFHMDTITNEVKWENELIKSLDQEHLTTTNIFYMKSQDMMGTLTAIDQFEITKHVDYLGYDLYPGSGNKLEKKSEFSAMFFDHAKSASQFANKNFWVAEAESGPIGGWVLGPDRNTTEVDIIRNQLVAIGHNAKGIMYQWFKDVPMSPINWGSIIKADGSKTRRFDAVKELGRLFERESDFLLKSNTASSKVALLVTKENQILMNGFEHEKFYIEELRGVYRYYWTKGFAIDFITTEQILNGECDKYQLIHAPLLAHLSDELGEGIKGYIRRGGKFISSARLGFLGTHGWMQHRFPGCDLDKALGFEIIELESHINPTIKYKDMDVEGYWHQEHIMVNSGSVVVLARFSDSSPAVVNAKLGKGSMLYFGTHFGQSFMQNSDLFKVLDDYLGANEIIPDMNISYEGKKNNEIEGHLIGTENRLWLILTHYLNKKEKNEFFKDNEVDIEIKINRSNIKSIKAVFQGKKINFRKHDNYIVLNDKVKEDKFEIYDIELI